jgi:hypothetical protein
MDSALNYTPPVVWHGRPINTWAAFHTIVKPGRPLLAALDSYTDPLFVAGCQRSGTTALARLLKRAHGMVDHTFGDDDELDAALLLSGHVSRDTTGRFCLQTTYLNDRVHEYFEHSNFRLIWMLREPRSVVNSMLHNWRRGALNRLFDACGAEVLSQMKPDAARGAWLGPTRLDKACASYVAKTSQTFELVERLGSRVAVVDYEELVSHKDELLPQLCEFAGLKYEPRLGDMLHARSIGKSLRLGASAVEHVDQFCKNVYERALQLRTVRT